MLWQEFGDLLLTNAANKLFSERRAKYFRHIKHRYGESVFRHEHIVKDFAEFVGENIGGKHRDLANSHRKNKYYNSIDSQSTSELNVWEYWVIWN